MDKVFLSILNMSLTASFVIVVVCLVRVFLRRAPKIISYVLWVVVLFNLVCPFKIESAFSLIPFKAQTIPTNITTQTLPHINSGIAIVDNTLSGALPVPDTTLGANANPLQVWTKIAVYAWLVGATLLLLYAVVAYARLKQRLSLAVRVEGNIYETDRITSPFVFGLIRPRIYIPTGMGVAQNVHIIEHERTHIKRYDYLVSIFAFIALTLHWFNPLVWVAYMLMLRDMESSCDEAVLLHSSIDVRCDYSSALLSFSRGKQGLPLPPAFGEQNVKERIKNVLKLKKTSNVNIAIAVILAIVVFVGCAVNKADVKFNSYIYDDSDRNVKFSIEYPEKWNLVEQRGWDGDETIEASPDTGILLDLSSDKSENEQVFVFAMLYASMSVDTENYDQSKINTESGLQASVFKWDNNGRTSILYAFETKDLNYINKTPLYYISVNMSTDLYKKNKENIDKLVNSFTFIESENP